MPGSTENLPIKKSALELPAHPDQFAYVKILILGGASEVSISVPGSYRVLDSEGRTLYKAPKLGTAKVHSNGKIIQIGIQPFHTNPVTIVSEKEGVKVQGVLYRHAIEIWRETNGKLMLINDIPMEDYLKGVLPSEVNPNWPMESLKAQAIASRTYALFKVLENQHKRYHLSKDVLSQVYKGKGHEHKLSNYAVEMTQGQILTYKGKIFPAYFHSTCGGYTTRAEYIWPVEPHPSLEGVECNFCWQSKHYRWAAEIPVAEIGKKLKARGFSIVAIKNLKMEDKDKTGRARFIGVETEQGTQKIHSNDFRLWVDPMKFKSTWIQSIDKKGDTFVFKGRGWGHGVGMCQYGIKQLGEMGYTADKIVRYYYPGSETVQYWTEQPKSIEASFRNFMGLVKQKLDLE